MERLKNNSRKSTNKEFARKLRKEMSYSERIFWQAVKRDRLGVRFRTQAQVGRWILDFYCPEAMVNVEIDGEQHAERMELDRVRDRELSEMGILVFRIPSLVLQDGFEYAQRYYELCRILAERTGKEIRQRW